MKYFLGMILLFSILMMQEDVFAQRRWGPDRLLERRPERLEKFRKMRLIEVLKLNEEDAVRFFAKQTVHEDKTHELMKKRNDILDEIERTNTEKGDQTKIEKLSATILEIDKDIFAERQRFQNELIQFLTPERFGKFLVFERDFGRQVRNAMEEMHQKKGNTPED